MLVRTALSTRPIAGSAWWSSDRRGGAAFFDVLAIDDALVARAVAWIREHADRRLTRSDGRARAWQWPTASRTALSRRARSRGSEEIRRAHVDRARHLLATTRAAMGEVVKRSGFTNAALLNVAFRRELGMPPERTAVACKATKTAGTMTDRPRAMNSVRFDEELTRCVRS